MKLSTNINVKLKYKESKKDGLTWIIIRCINTKLKNKQTTLKNTTLKN